MVTENIHPDKIERPDQEDQDKQFNIIVNGRSKAVLTDELTFDEVVKLAFDSPPTGADVMFTVTYRNGGGRPLEGSLVRGGLVKVQDGTVFNVTATDKS